MTRKWSARLLALGGLALALGCRSHPSPPPCSTPLLPDEVLTSKPPTRVSPPDVAIVPPGAQLPTKTSILPPNQFTKLPSSTQPNTHLPNTGPDTLSIVPPKDVAPLLNSQPQPGPAPRLLPGPGTTPVIKPLLIEAPRPPAGPDGFGPAPIIPLPEPPVTTVPVKRPVEDKTPALPLKQGEKLGHGPDYKWVAGVLDKHQKGGYWMLRFADASDDDPWGGKVRLLADERLAGFDNGDIVYVEGELLAPRTADSAAYPPFRVTEVRLVEKAK